MNDATSPLSNGPFAGPTEFAQLVRNALACAAQEGWPSMVWCDADFDDWPLREKAVVESLHAWSRKGGRLTLLARSYDAVQRNQHLFVQWRGLWGHLIECRLNKHLVASEFPSALWSPVWAMRRLDVARSAGVAGTEPRSRVLLREELEECRRQSSPGFPASILGL